MTLSAARLDVASGKDRLFPGQRAAVRLFDGGCRSLPAMAHHAPELLRGVRNHGMLAIGLQADVGKTGFFQAQRDRRCSDRRRPVPDARSAEFRAESGAAA